MSVGAKNAMDKRLVELYKDKQTLCSDNKSQIDAKTVWDNMQMIAVTNQAYMFINNKKFSTMKIA
jgi:hypothetical protein